MIMNIIGVSYMDLKSTIPIYAGHGLENFPGLLVGDVRRTSWNGSHLVPFAVANVCFRHGASWGSCLGRWAQLHLLGIFGEADKSQVLGLMLHHPCNVAELLVENLLHRQPLVSTILA